MTPKYQLSKYIVLTDLIDAETSSDPSRLLYATRTGKSILIKDRVLQALRERNFAEVEDKHLITLLTLEVIVPEGQDEFSEILQRNVLALKDSKNLNVTIQPTANCQLGCGYCGQVHSKKNVDAEMSAKITDRIIGNLRNNPYESLHVQWFGAEPLMAFSEILKMSDRLIESCKESGVAYSAHMITNGLSFKPAVFLKLLEKKVTHYQITLDGLGETHDVMRITKEGKKTFDIIFGNIVDVASLPEFAENKCNISVRVNVNKTSAKSIYKLIDRLAHFELQKKGVTINFAPIFDWGGNNATENGLTKEEFATSEIDWILYAMQKGFRFGRVLPRKKNQPCMVVEKDGEVYDAAGNIYPCYEYPYTPKYEGPEYKIGHVDTINEQRNANAVTKNWFEDIKTDIAPCKTCNLFPVCGGGCPKQWYNGEIACPSYKANIKDKIVMHYLTKKDGFLKDHLTTAELK